AIQYWDGISLAGNGAVEGGSGVWNATNTNWTKSSGAINDVWRGVSAIFQNGSGTVVIQDIQTISALQFKSDGYVLYADVADGLNLVNGTGGSALVTVDSGITGTLDTPLSGTGKLQKSGAGTLVLTRSNRYSGGTTLSAGTLLVRDDAALGSAALSLASGTTLQTDRFEQRLANNLVFSGVSNINVDAGSLTLSGGVSGAGGLIKIGTGSLTLSGNNTQLGNTWLNAGGLVLGSNTALGAGALITAHNTTLDSSLSGALIGNNVALNGDLTVLGTRDMSLTGVVSGTTNLTKTGASTLSLTGANTLSGTVTLNQGTLRLGQSASMGNASLVVSGASSLESGGNVTLSRIVNLQANLTVAGANDLTFASALYGTGGLIKDGSGKLTLNMLNLYQGTTTLKNGTVVLGGTLGTGQLNVTGTATLETLALPPNQSVTLDNANVAINGALTVNTAGRVLVSGTVSGTGSLTKTGAETLSLTNSSTFGGIYNIDGGRLSTNLATSLGNPTQVNIASGASLLLANGGTTEQLNGAGSVQISAGDFRVGAGTFSGDMSPTSGSGGLVKFGNGTLSLSGNNTLSSIVVDGGTLRFDGQGSGPVSVQNGATLTGSGALTDAVTIANGGHLSLAGGSVLTLGSLVLNDTSNLDVALGAVTPGAAGLANVTGNLTLDGRLNIANTGGFGIGVYRLFDYGGTLTNNGLDFGTLPSGVPLNELALQTNVANQINLVVGGAADIRFWDGSQLTGNSVVDGGDGTWNSTNSNWTTTNAGFNEAWNSTFAVFQGAAGTVTVDGTQSVTGLQFINNYTLAGGSAGQLQLVSGISGDTAVRVDSGKTAILDVNLTGNGILNKLDSGTLVLNGSNSHTDGTRLSGGTLVLGNNDALGSGSLTTSAGTTLDTNTALSLINDLHLNGALTLGGSHDLVLNGLVLGNGTLVKNGSGTLTLNQANDYAGTTLNAGTLLLGNSAALGVGQLTVAGPASLDTSAAMTLGNAIDFGVNTGSRLTLAGNHDLTLSGVLSGNGTLIKQGVGTVDLTGNNDFSGSYRIDNGRLNLLGSTTTGNPAIDISTAGTLGVGASSAVGLLSGQGAIALENNSVLTVAGGNYTGAISGTGGLNKAGLGILTLSGVSSISGTTTVSEGTLSVTGQGVLGTSGLTVANGATLAGTGRIDGAVTLADGGHVQLASSTTLTTGALTLNNDANLDAFLGAAVAGQAGMLKVNGNLVLDGKLNVTDAGGFGLGVYRLIDYTGSLTDNGLAIGTIPGGLVAGDLEVQTSVNNQVNLLVGGAAG
ncbi:beta strand repeat-containing protein, partial [Pseudomonas sp. 5P_5.1_Bac1]|uniref:beta strand repeat-containing protein n=1 Tax=Pseudomonas sp. 5P_5.1_Bac1 TaxID=2971616 RepID=UPI0021C7797D